MEHQTADYVVRYRGDVLLLRFKIPNLTGILDVNRIGGEIMAMIDAGQRKVVLDLKHIDYAGSAALGMFLEIAKRLKSLNGRLVLSHAEKIEPLLKVSRTEKMFELTADPKEAIALLGGR
jgi:stage II sporulation protein AA (anti-sigma F factor antagonist)